MDEMNKKMNYENINIPTVKAGAALELVSLAENTFPSFPSDHPNTIISSLCYYLKMMGSTR